VSHARLLLICSLALLFSMLYQPPCALLSCVVHVLVLSCYSLLRWVVFACDTISIPPTHFFQQAAQHSSWVSIKPRARSEPVILPPVFLLLGRKFVYPQQQVHPFVQEMVRLQRIAWFLIPSSIGAVISHTRIWRHVRYSSAGVELHSLFMFNAQVNLAKIACAVRAHGQSVGGGRRVSIRRRVSSRKRVCRRKRVVIRRYVECRKDLLCRKWLECMEF
jgi:hypothetical protein